MDELLKVMGLQLVINEISISIQRSTIFIEQSSPVTSSGNTWSIGYSNQYSSIVWTFQTEFGQQLEKYNAKQWNKQMYPYSQLVGLTGITTLQLGQPTTGTGTFGLSQSSIQSGAALSQHALQQQQVKLSQAQQVMQQAQARYPIVIKNIQDTEEKKSWGQRVKDWFL